ncbi:hypothetical protein AURDEDRAFT_171299 [Auricularia subglabra TFB-10046 SS5]|nr:hypothetical protein AURDEDRAFT_171299 [Auricularia subglabra TFB-10046 SS5]
MSNCFLGINQTDTTVEYADDKCNTCLSGSNAGYCAVPGANRSLVEVGTPFERFIHTAPASELLNFNGPSISMKSEKLHGKHASRACSWCQRRKIKCDGAVPRCGSCVKKNQECLPSAKPDRRTTAGRSGTGITARVAELKVENDFLARQNALLRAEIANGGDASDFLYQTPAKLEGPPQPPDGPVVAPSSLVPMTALGSAPSIYGHQHVAQSFAIPYAATGGHPSQPSPAFPLVGAHATGPDFDCIGDMSTEDALFPFGCNDPFSYGAWASSSRSTM